MNGIVERADRQQPRAEQRARQAERRRAAGTGCSRRCRARCAGRRGAIAQSWAETTFSSRNTSSRSRRSKMPRRLTQPPRLVETVTSGDVVTMRLAERAVAGGEVVEDAAEAFLRRHRRRARHRRSSAGSGSCGVSMLAREALRERHVGEEALELRRGECRGRRSAPTPAPSAILLAALEAAICSGFIRPGVVVLVAGEGQAEALDRVGDEAGRLVVVAAASKASSTRLHVVAGEIGHQRVQRRVVVARRAARGCPGTLAEVAQQMRAPARRRPCRPAPSRASWGSRRSSRAARRRPARRTPPPAACRI